MKTTTASWIQRIRTIIFWINRLLTFAAIAALLFIGFIAYAITDDPHDSWWFDEKIWKTNYHGDVGKTERYKMVYDLKHRVLNRRMTKTQIVALLGPPDASREARSKRSLNYYISGSDGLNVFEVKLDANGKFSSAWWFIAR